MPDVQHSHQSQEGTRCGDTACGHIRVHQHKRCSCDRNCKRECQDRDGCVTGLKSTVTANRQVPTSEERHPRTPHIKHQLDCHHAERRLPHHKRDHVCK